MVESCGIENYGTEEDFEFEKYCALIDDDYDSFISMVGGHYEGNPNNYFSEETRKKFQARYLLGVLNDERPDCGVIRNGIKCIKARKWI